jgi:integrase
VRFDDAHLPVWHEASGRYLDPATGEILPDWDQALDTIGPDDEPLHVARFGPKFDAQGVLAGSRDSARCIGYLTKYLTKHLGDCHQAATGPAADHAARLADALRYEPCSPTCANWLRYGIQPRNPREGLRPKTVVLYRYLLRKHIAPGLGHVAIADLQPRQVRRWRQQLLDAKVSEVTVAKAYPLLKAVLNTAADDGVIRRNPCRIKGAGQEKSAERPVLTITQVYALADAVPERYRALILLAMFTSIRWGELAALRRCDLDLTARTVRVTRQLTEVRGGGHVFGPPKSEAGKRVVTIPEVVGPAVQWHLSCFAASDDEGLIFASPEGKPLHHSNFRRRVWLPALKKAELPGIHFHDLRHTGNTLAASTGATMRELMDRMGHDSQRAAMIYLHGSEARQHEIADSLSRLARQELKRGSKRGSGRASGTQRARRRPHAS